MRPRSHFVVSALSWLSNRLAQIGILDPVFRATAHTGAHVPRLSGTQSQEAICVECSSGCHWSARSRAEERMRPRVCPPRLRRHHRPPSRSPPLPSAARRHSQQGKAGRSREGPRQRRRLKPYTYGIIGCMKKTLHIDEQLLREAKSAAGSKTDTNTVRLGLEALIRRAAYERLRALRGSEPRARDIRRRRERSSSDRHSAV
jgi:Arc/MetJ family transcription regulator